MAHLRKQIRDAAATALEAISGITVFTNRTRPIESSDLPAMEVRTPSETVERLDKSPRSDRSLALEVLIYTEGDTAPDQAADWAVDIEAALIGNAALAALITDIDVETVTFESNADAEAAYWSHRITWDVRYVTLESDPETK